MGDSLARSPWEGFAAVMIDPQAVNNQPTLDFPSNAQPLPIPDPNSQGTLAQASDSVPLQIPGSNQPLTHVPGYEILDELGRGGMGVVYKAKHKGLNRIVALKMVLHGGHAGSQGVQRFKAEAEAVAQLQHPNIVQIFEIGEQAGLPFFTLEFVDGGSLAGSVAQNPLSAKEAAWIVEQLAQGMQYAHDKGVVHRDLKPENVLLTSSGRPKITDFGLAKRIEGNSNLTNTGAIMGTPSYMAPEQAGGKTDQIGPTTDIYALGAILYRLLTGRPPFQAPTPLDTVMQVVSEEPVPIRQLLPNVPKDLETICHKCLQKDPAKRYTTAKQLSDDLECFLDGRPITARPVGRIERTIRWGKRNPSIASLLALVLLVLVGGSIISTYFAIEANESEKQAKEAAERATENERLALKREDEAKQALADLQREKQRLADLVYVNTMNIALPAWQAGNTRQVKSMLQVCDPARRGWEWNYLTNLFEVQCRELSGHAGPVRQGFLSPDGSKALTRSMDKTIRLWDARNGGEITAYPGGADLIALSPDGSRLAVLNGNFVQIFDVNTSLSVKQVRLPDQAIYGLAYVRSGTQIATCSSDGQVRFLDAVTGEEKATCPKKLKLDPATGNLFGQIGQAVSFSADGKYVGNAGSHCRVNVWDTETGESVLDVKDHLMFIESVAFHPKSGIVASAGADGMVYIWDLATKKKIKEFKAHDTAIHMVAFTPNGERLVSVSDDQTMRLWDWKKPLELLTFRGHMNEVTHVSFDASGRWAITSGYDNLARVWDLRERVWYAPHVDKYFATEQKQDFGRTGSQEFLTLYGHAAPSGCVALSPDGRYAVSSALGDWQTLQQVTVWNLQTQQAERTLPILGSMLHRLTYSPDGKILVVASSGGQTPDPGQLIAFDTQTWDIKWIWKGPLSVELAPIFSADGQRLFATSQGSGIPNFLLAWNAADGTKELYRKPLAGLATRCQLSPDESEVFFADVLAGRIEIHDAKTGEKKPDRSWQVTRVPIVDVACNNKGTVAVSVGTDGRIKLYDWADRKEVATLEGHSNLVIQLAFSPDGTRLLSGGSDQSARLWNVQTGQELFALRPHRNGLTWLGWSRNGSKFATACADGAVRIWEAPQNTIPDTSNWIPFYQDNFDRTVLGDAWNRDRDQSQWEIRDGVLYGKHQMMNYGGTQFTMAMLTLMQAEMPRTVEVRFSYKASKPMGIATAFTDRRTARSYVPTLLETDQPYGEPSASMTQVLIEKGQPKVTPNIGTRKYSVTHGEWQQVRVIRESELLRVYVNGTERFRYPIPDVDLEGFSFQTSWAEVGDEIAVDNFEVRAPASALREQRLRNKVETLFDQILFHEETERRLDKDTSIQPEDRPFVKKVLEQIYPDLTKLKDHIFQTVFKNHLPAETYELAVKQAQHSLTKEPTDKHVITNLGLAYYRIGQWQKAIEHLQKGMDLQRKTRGSAYPYQHGFIALCQKKLNQIEAAERSYQQMQYMLKFSDYWAKDGWMNQVCAEVISQWPKTEPKPEEELVRIFTRGEQDGWLKHELEPFMAMFDPTTKSRFGIRPQADARDVHLNYEQVLAQRKIHFASEPAPASSFQDVENVTVQIDGDTANVELDLIVHFGNDYHVYRIRKKWIRKEQTWKAIEVDQWQLSEKNGDAIITLDEAEWQRRDAEVEKRKSANKPQEYIDALLRAKRFAEAAKAAEEAIAKRPSAYLWIQRGDATFELGDVATALTYFRKAWAMDPDIGEPWYLSSIYRRFRVYRNTLSVAWMPDGQRLIAGGLDLTENQNQRTGTARIVHVAGNKEEKAFEKQPSPITAVAIRRDGKHLATALGDKQILLWDVDTGNKLLTLPGHPNGIYRIAFDAEGKRLVSASSDSTACVWDTSNGQLIWKLEGHKGEVLGAMFSPDGSQIATASHDKTVKLWDANTGKELHTFTGHKDLVKRVVFTPDGKQIVSCSDTVRIWNLETKAYRELKANKNLIDSLAISSDGHRMATGSFQGEVRIWDLPSGKQLRKLNGPQNAVYCLDFAPDGKRLASAGPDGIFVWNLELE